MFARFVAQYRIAKVRRGENSRADAAGTLPNAMRGFLFSQLFLKRLYRSDRLCQI
jgi:hypothetical protein